MISKFAAQFMMIENIKNFVKNSGRPWHKKENNTISEEVAKRIQKKSYEHRKITLSPAYYPPYLSIADQLQVENEQIFCAAVFNLTETALNIKNYRSHIVQLLQQTLKNNDLSHYQIKTVKKAIEKIKALTD